MTVTFIDGVLVVICLIQSLQIWIHVSKSGHGPDAPMLWDEQEATR